MTRKLRDKVFVFECNRCGETLATKQRKLKDAIREMRDKRWRYHNHGIPGNQYTHYCPKCRNK
jgi:predicted RNA-binding Zn-ribbon protein involved in translation (DUF1610 family)